MKKKISSGCIYGISAVYKVSRYRCKCTYVNASDDYDDDEDTSDESIYTGTGLNVSKWI